VGAIGNPHIADAMATGDVALVPLGEVYRNGVEKNWECFYRWRFDGVLGGGCPESDAPVNSARRFFEGAVYDSEVIQPTDYPNVRSDIETFSVPDAVVADESADPTLVAAVAAEAFTAQEEFETALWPNNPGGRSMPGPDALVHGPLYCFVPLNPAAVDYYEEQHRTLPDCSG
jgi:hypothetical protein